MDIFKSVYKTFFEEIEKFNQNKFDKRNMFNCVMKAAFAKNIEFNYFLHYDSADKPYFL